MITVTVSGTKVIIGNNVAIQCEDKEQAERMAHEVIMTIVAAELQGDI